MSKPNRIPPSESYTRVRGTVLEALYDELAARDRELARLRAQLGGLRSFAFGGDPQRCADRRPFDFMAAVESALAATRGDLRGVIVCVHIQPLPVQGSPAAITQVLVHLLTNAAAAMRSSGRPPVVHIDAAVLGQRAQVRVSDNGRGIADEAMRRLFEPFYSSGGTGLGLGLGLTISSAIVRAHGGRLACANRIPHGARFTFDLPLAASGAVARPTPRCAARIAAGEAA